MSSAFAACSLLALVALSCPLAAREDAESPRTTAERSDYRATSRHGDVIEFGTRLAERSPWFCVTTLGTSHEGRSLPLWLLSSPPVSTPEEAAETGKLVVLLIGNIHGGEVCGKEALQMLAREIGTASDPPLLKQLLLAIVPIYNPDGNERVSTRNRPRQVGPDGGVGTRRNAQGLDLNRDWVKLEAPETRALVRFLRTWDPAVIIDTHTTNGSYHRYDLTYAGPKNPAGDMQLIEYVRDTLLPAVRRAVKEKTGRATFLFGDFKENHARWETYPDLPRYGTPYRGLRNRVAILSEAYAYAPFRERVLATRDFVRTCLEHVAENRQEIQQLLAAADGRTVSAGKEPREEDRIVLRSRPVAGSEKVPVSGFVEVERDGRHVPTSETREYDVQLVQNFEPLATVPRPRAYLFPAALASVLENLQRHGIRVEELREDIELDVEVYRVSAVTRAPASFEKHDPVEVEASRRPETRRVEAGTLLVRTAQPLGTLAACLLEPESADGLVTWNFFDSVLEVGKDFPVLRLLSHVPLTTVAARPLEEDRPQDLPITFEAVYESRQPPRFGGSPVRGLRWLDDGEHYLQVKEGRLLRIHAPSGRSEPFHDVDAMARALSRLPAMDDRAARRIASGTSFHSTADRRAALIEYQGDLYHCAFDGSQALRLTSSPQSEELPSFSPDGSLVAFVRENDLWVVDVATRTERALTVGGTETLRRGKADWVYYEEIFSRTWRVYWWSPDSRHIAFLEVDSSPVKEFTVVDDLPARQTVERTPYPKPGEPNPLVRLGVVSCAGGEVKWADLSAYEPADLLVTGVGWWPDGETVYFFAQNRVQTWLDFCVLPAAGGKSTRLFRETNGAWVYRLESPHFLADGSFLITSDRTGWSHLYHYLRGGKLKRALTHGEWEVRRLERVEEKEGEVYFSGTLDSPIANHLYRVDLDGGSPERLTAPPGDHQVSVAPGAKYFIDRWSDHTVPTRVALRNADGSPARMIDTNPVGSLEEYRSGKIELLQVETADGFLLEASLLRPPDFDPANRYPVWVMTYGGPHAQTVRDRWSYSWAWDQVLAQSGVLVFRVDPRSASGKGAVSAWTCYKQLGVQELRDLGEAVAWLHSQPYVDSARIGISGHSYGGFLTAYAMTHSRHFAAGIAGAPVTDWRDYDTIYTERYMLTPRANPGGYGATSVVDAAADLHGRLLLLHGAIDDNVHAQNSIKLARALQASGKQFELMIYPGSRHGLGGRHYNRLRYDFIRRAFGVEEAEPPSAAGSASGRTRRF